MRVPSLPIEVLELRRHYAAGATVGFQNHALTVRGSATAANVITVGVSADGRSVVATDTVTVGTGAQARAVTVTKVVLLSKKVRAVHITGGGGDDAITVDQTHGSFTIRTTITGGGGNDTVQGGDEPDRIYGNAGDDSLVGGGGGDVLLGGAGNDTLIGGPGDDYLNGDGGHDYLEGDDGNDTLHDARGPDTILGGAGMDRFEVHSPKRDIDTDYDPAFDKLQVIPAPGPVDTSTTIGSILGGLFPITSLL